MSQNQNVTNSNNTKSNCDNFTIDKGGIHLVHTQFLAFFTPFPSPYTQYDVIVIINLPLLCTHFANTPSPPACVRTK